MGRLALIFSPPASAHDSVISIAIAAPVAFYLELRTPGVPMMFANGVMSVVWFLCTLAAFITARNRQLTAHRQWMIRSYVFTLNFLITRIPNPIPRYFQMSATAFALNLLFLTICYLFFTDVYFNWHELTTSRKTSRELLLKEKRPSQTMC